MTIALAFLFFFWPYVFGVHTGTWPAYHRGHLTQTQRTHSNKYIHAADGAHFFHAMVLHPGVLAYRRQNASCFKVNDPNVVSHECLSQYLLNECRIFGIMLTAISSGRGWHRQFFYWGPVGLAQVVKTCSDQPRAFRKVSSSKAFPQEENILFSFSFLNQPVPMTPRHVCKKTSRKYSKIWLRRANI